MGETTEGFLSVVPSDWAYQRIRGHTVPGNAGEVNPLVHGLLISGFRVRVSPGVYSVREHGIETWSMQPYETTEAGLGSAKDVTFLVMKLSVDCSLRL